MTKILKWRLAATSLLIILLLVPGSNITPFDGLPLNPSELAVTAAFLAVLWGTSWYKVRPRLWLGLLTALIVWQLVGAAAFPAGWSVCMRREIQTDRLKTPCEPSAQFLSGNRTYIWPELDIKNNQFPLHFFNQREFNFYGEGSPDRNKLPYSFKATAVFQPARGASIVIDTNTPGTYIEFQDKRTDVMPDYPVTLELPASQISRLAIGFTAPNDEANSLSVTTGAKPFYREPVFTSHTAVWIYRLVFLLLSAWLILLTLASIAGEISNIGSLDRRILLLTVFLAATPFSLSEAPPSLYYTLSAAVILVYCLRSHDSAKLTRATAILSLLLLSMHYTSLLVPYESTSFLEGGNDPLTHESDARSVLLGQSWKDRLAGGEPDMVFYYQPLYRYFAALPHALLGDSLWAPYTFQLFLSGLMLLFATEFLTIFAGFRYSAVFHAVLLFFWNHAEVSPLILATTTYQESWSLPLFVMAVAGLLWMCFASKLPPEKYSLLFGLILGSALGIRTELLPSLPLIIPFLIAIRKRAGLRQAVSHGWRLLSGIFLPFAFIGFRNLTIAGKMQFLTSSGGVNVADPFLDIIPRGASIAASQIYTGIISTYWNRPFELASILFRQAQSAFLGSDLSTPAVLLSAYILSAAVTIAGVYVFFRNRWTDKSAVLILFASAALPALAGTVLLQDNLLALRAHYSTLFAFSAIVILSRLRRAKDQTPSRNTLNLQNTGLFKHPAKARISPARISISRAR